MTHWQFALYLVAYLIGALVIAIVVHWLGGRDRT
jgi:hypothetical protein